MRQILDLIKLIIGFGLACFALLAAFLLLKAYYDYFGWAANDWLTNYVDVIGKEADRNIGNTIPLLICFAKCVGCLIGLIIVNFPVLMLFSTTEYNPIKIVQIRKA